MVEHRWESANGRSRTVIIVLPKSKVEEVLGELREGASRGHVGVSKTLDKIRQEYYHLYPIINVERS
jgi:hypothetical protein